MRATAHQPTEPHYSTFEADRERRLTPGSLLPGGQLELVAEVACGGTSVVYRAIDHANGGRHVALKVVNAGAPPAIAAARFRNEIRLMKSLTGHPHVVPAVATGRLDGPSGFEGRPYLLTHFIEGVALDRVMGDHRRGLDWRRACTIARDLVRALVDLHERGIVHRDIKPGNVLLAQGARERAMLVDFGVAHATGDGWEVRSPDLTREDVPGTLLYMSPQQIAHERPMPSMDVYSFGITLYELLSGNPPHHKLTHAEILARKCDPSRPPFPLAKLCPELDRRITGLVERCLHYEAVERPTARELLSKLEAVLGGPRVRASSGPRLAPRATPRPEPMPVELQPPAHEPTATPQPHVLQPPPQARRRWMTVGAGVAFAVLAAGVMARALAPGEVVTHEPVPPQSAAIRRNAATDPPTTVAPAVVADPPHHPAPVVVQPSARVPEPAPAPAAARAKSKQRLEKCPEIVSAAKKAAEGREWGSVIRLTKSDACWRPHASEERVRLRVQALFETLRYDECAKAGEGATAPDILRWAHICAGKSRQGSP